MTARVLEAGPDLDEGRDPGLASSIVEAMRAAGADVLASTMGRDHHRLGGDLWSGGRKQGWPHAGAHPMAGAARAGARRSLLAWNVVLSGLSHQDAAAVADEIRECGGGPRGLRAPVFDLPRRGAIQVSMNLEDMRTGSPTDVVHTIEARAAARGGHIVETDVAGTIPDELLRAAAGGPAPIERSGGRAAAVQPGAGAPGRTLGQLLVRLR